MSKFDDAQARIRHLEERSFDLDDAYSDRKQAFEERSLELDQRFRALQELFEERLDLVTAVVRSENQQDDGAVADLYHFFDNLYSYSDEERRRQHMILEDEEERCEKAYRQERQELDAQIDNAYTYRQRVYLEEQNGGVGNE